MRWGEAEDLSATEHRGESGGGNTTVTFTMTNTSSDPCRVAGHPKIEAVGHGNGTTLGQPAANDDKSGAPEVVKPNGHVEANMRMVNIGTGGGPLAGKCDPVQADGWRILPNHAKTSLFVKDKGLNACSTGVDWLTVSPITPLHS